MPHELSRLATAAASLGDKLARVSVAERLDEIERALKFDPNPEYRRELRREFLDLTDRQKDIAA